MSKARDIADLLDSAGRVTADDLDVGAIGGRRNLIINGAMQVAQRGTSSSGQSQIGYLTVDRFGGNVSNAGSFTFTDSQATDAPSNFSYSS